jgi:hypothetical protein
MISKLFKDAKPFIDGNTPFYDRRMVIVGTEEKVQELNNQIDWKNTAIDSLTGRSYWRFLDNARKGKLSPFSIKKNIPALEINSARERFKFPIQHPIDGVVYCCIDTEPDLYLPLASFHDKFFETKMNAFIELCSNLNAKEIKVVYAEENGKTVSVKGGAKNIPTPKGTVGGTLSAGGNTQNDTDKDIFYSFTKPTKPIKKYESTWLNAEPSWKKLQQIRIEGDAERGIANFSHVDEMGITADLAAGLKGMGANIGGTYKELITRRFEFNVEFWPKEEWS